MTIQAEPRFRKRVPCRVDMGGTVFNGMVLNLSRRGLFVQTTAPVKPGGAVSLSLSVEGDPVPLLGNVRWNRIVAPHLRAVQTGGMGVRIQDAPDSYYRLLSRVSRDGGAGAEPVAGQAAPVSDPPASIQYRVRVQQDGGPRSRTLRVGARDLRDARRFALNRVGAGWTILGIDEL